MFNYLTNNHLDPIFDFVAKRYGRQEEVPTYRENPDGIAKLLGVLERARMELYYPTLLEKATHLLLSINKGALLLERQQKTCSGSHHGFLNN
jgi:hypothetical protein